VVLLCFFLNEIETMSDDHDSVSAGIFDEPLLIVLDEDDDEDLSHIGEFLLTSTRDVLLDPDEISTTGNLLFIK
jgi:hypothetical protein